MRPRRQIPISDVHIVDGGMASELEFLGADINGPLWSAYVLEEDPEKVIAVHRSYLEAGAEVLLTASYQVSRAGYVQVGLCAADADRALLRAVDLAALAAGARNETAGPILIGASLGPYGAVQHNGAEYHGNYDCSYAELVKFHQERIAVLAGSKADLLAFETLPSLEEAEAIGEALKPWPDLAAWFTFNCPETQAPKLAVAHGEPLRACAALAASFPQTIAVGVNCTQPVWMVRLIEELKKASTKPIVVYPNSGEGWDAGGRSWTGSSDAAGFGEQAGEWFAAGAQLVGGCCRTRPEHIRMVALAANSRRSLASVVSGSAG